MTSLARLLAKLVSLEKGRRSSFQENFAVEDGEPELREAKLGGSGTVEYTCTVVDGKRTVVGLVEEDEVRRVNVGVKDAPDFVGDTRQVVDPGETITESVDVPANRYFIVAGTGPGFFQNEPTVVDSDVNGSVVELEGEVEVQATSFVKALFS